MLLLLTVGCGSIPECVASAVVPVRNNAGASITTDGPGRVRLSLQDEHDIRLVFEDAPPPRRHLV